METRFSLWRIDDNENWFLVQDQLSRDDAERLLAEFTARGHKQTYWIEDSKPRS